MDVMAETMGPRDFSRLLAETYGLRMSHQAVSKANYLPKIGAGRVVVRDALVVLADKGRIHLPDDPTETAAVTAELPLADAPSGEPKNGRPAQAGGLAAEQILTERVKRARMEMDLAEKEGKLLRVDDVTDAMVTAGRRIGEAFEQMPTLADELVSVALSTGAHGVRDLLRRQVRTMREQLAEALTLAEPGEIEDETE